MDDVYKALAVGVVRQGCFLKPRVGDIVHCFRFAEAVVFYEALWRRGGFG